MNLDIVLRSAKSSAVEERCPIEVYRERDDGRRGRTHRSALMFCSTGFLLLGR